MELKRKKTKGILPYIKRKREIYDILRYKDSHFRWSFSKFLWEIMKSKRYKLLSLKPIHENSFAFIIILDTKDYIFEGSLRIEYAFINIEVLSNPYALNALRMQLNKYDIYNYRQCYILLDIYNKEISTLLEAYLKFKPDINRNILSKARGEDTNKIRLVKML